MPFLRPRVGKINVQRGHRARRQKILQKIRRLYPHAAQIRQPGAPALAVQFADAAQQPFDADEIPVRMPPRVFDEKRSVAAAQFHFQRLWFWKKLRQVQPFDDGNAVGRPDLLDFPRGFSNRKSQIVNQKSRVVGAVRFELTTSCTRNKRATRLRYAPTSERNRLPARDAEGNVEFKEM